MIKFGCPLFCVDDVESCISFYKNAFGFEPGFVDKENKQYAEKCEIINNKTLVNLKCY